MNTDDDFFPDPKQLNSKLNYSIFQKVFVGKNNKRKIHRVACGNGWIKISTTDYNLLRKRFIKQKHEYAELSDFCCKCRSNLFCILSCDEIIIKNIIE